MKTDQEFIIELRELEKELQFRLKKIQACMKIMDGCEQVAVPIHTHHVIEAAKGVLIDKVCKHCGKSFTPTSGIQKYCSVECRNNFYHIKPPETIHSDIIPEIFQSKINSQNDEVYEKLGTPVSTQPKIVEPETKKNLIQFT